MSQQTSNHSFDELARGLATGSISRGKALRLMGAALLGGTLASLGGVASAEQGDQGQNEECKAEGKKCRKNHQCCSGTCTEGQCAAACTSNGGTCTTNVECCSGRCASGTCR